MAVGTRPIARLAGPSALRRREPAVGCSFGAACWLSLPAGRSSASCLLAGRRWSQRPHAVARRAPATARSATSPGARSRAELCLSCHKPVADRIRDEEGRAPRRDRRLRALPRRARRRRRRAAAVRPEVVRSRRRDRLPPRRPARAAGERLREVPQDPVVPDSLADLRDLPHGRAQGDARHRLPHLSPDGRRRSRTPARGSTTRRRPSR